MSVSKRMKTIIRILILILNLIIITRILILILNVNISTPQLLSKSYYWLSTMLGHLMLLLPGSVVSKFQDTGLGLGDVVISSLSLFLQIRDALRLRMSSLKGRSRAAEVSPPFSLLTEGSLFSAGSCRDKYYSLVFWVC